MMRARALVRQSRVRSIGRMMTTNRFMLAALLLAVSVSSAWAQGGPAAVTVRVLLVAEPVEAADVSAGGMAAVTDAAGEATLRLEAGSHVLRVRKFGIRAVEQALLVRAGRDTTVVVRVAEAAIEHEAVIVTSTRADRRVEDEPIRSRWCRAKRWRRSC
jgi:hypothetical protein